jgi:hypothetical protein
MNAERVAAIASAVLYEGYILYPYRPSALKNRQRFNFGVLAPRDCRAVDPSTPSFIQAQCLATVPERALEDRVSPRARVMIFVRFLHLTTRRVERGPKSGAVDRDALPEGEWQEAIEREVAVDARLVDLAKDVVRWSFAFDAAHDVTPGSRPDDATTRVSRNHERLCGDLAVSATAVGEGVWRVTVHVENTTPVTGRNDPARGGMLSQSMVSTHVVLNIAAGEFVSLLDPPADLADRAAVCVNTGVWPVLVGDEGDRDAILASPIILYDYPQIAPESAGDFFDGTEIDEMLVLRILTMTDREKDEMRAGDPRARRLLERTESLPDEQLATLHGALRGLRPSPGLARHE